MPKKERVVIYLDLATLESLQRLKERSGASIAELCRRAITEWLYRTNRKLS